MSNNALTIFKYTNFQPHKDSMLVPKKVIFKLCKSSMVVYLYINLYIYIVILLSRYRYEISIRIVTKNLLSLITRVFTTIRIEIPSGYPTGKVFLYIHIYSQK